MLFLARAESFQYLFLSLPKDGSKRKSVFDDVLFDLYPVPWVKTHGWKY